MKLSDDLKFGFLLLAVILSLLVQCYHPDTVTERAKIFYDCRISEISPDVPPKVKEECRKLMQKGK